jgi:hypothetical protein
MILEVTRVGQEYRVTAEFASVRFRSLTPHHDGPTAIIECLDLTIGGKPHVDRLNLLSSRGRAALASALSGRWGGRPWSEIIDDACFEVYRRLTEGEAPAPLIAHAPSPDAWLIDGLIPLDEITVLYADGGSLKSWFALALSVAALRNEPLAPAARWCVRQCLSVLYLDWETDRRTHERRLWRLCQGYACSPPADIHYLSLRGQPLHTTIDSLASHTAKLGTDLLILDSLGMACGDEPETAQANLRTLGALSTLPGTKLVLAHVNAQTATQPSGPGRPYGSVFIRNTARSAIEARAEPEEGGALVTYHHRKANDAPLLPAGAIRWAFEAWHSGTGGGAVTLYSTAPDLQHASISTQIEALLASGSQSVATLAELLDHPEGTIRKELHRLEKRGRVVQTATHSPGRGHKNLWGLVDRKRGTVDP